MTATATPPTTRAGGADGASPLAGTAALVRFGLRRDRVKLPAWTAGVGVFTLYLVGAIPAAYSAEEGDLAGAAQLFGDPVGRMLTGPAYGLDAPTYERFVAGGYGLYFLLLVALMSLLLVTRHTRAEEQTGRAELVRAGVVGRHAPLTATLVVAALTNLAAGLAVLAVMTGVGGYDPAGAGLFAVGVAVTGLAFAGVAAVTVQLSASSRAAGGLAGAVLGAAFVIRAGGDMAGEGGSALSWASPLAWAQQTAPFVLDRWWPLGLTLAFAAVAAAAGYALSSRRDLGASLLAVRAGRARAGAALGTPLGLALRLQRPLMLGWGAALVLMGLVYGAFTDALLAAAGDMPEAFLELFGGAEGMLAGYQAYMAVFMAFLAAGYAVMAVQGVRAEETRGRAEAVLTTAVGRVTWLASHLAVIAGGVVVLMVATGAATGLGTALVTGQGGHTVDLTLAHLGHVPAVLVVGAVAALLYGVVPRAVPAAWALVGYGLVVGTFGPLLDLPQAAFDASPFEHAAAMPQEAFAAGPVVALLGLAAALAALGALALRRRDLEGR